jgi:nitroimidazol reductase NimA-like FMN-containing flavoprotein (pyridoxamine 5'-phosphate oxidase superfamily)
MVREGEWLYFHSAAEGHKIDNIRLQNRVCISCVGDLRLAPGEFSIGFESAVINGVVSEITDQEEKIRVLRLISKRYTPDNMAGFDAAVQKHLERTGVWKIHIDGISGKGK